jgi:REP-associated tyrosine transposase
MGRPIRLKAPEVTYHITSRTNGKRLFIKKSKDRKKLCRCLQRIKLKYSAKIYGFTPMTNHFHLLIKLQENADISKFMCEFKTAYAKYFNTKYNVSGHFWGDRFKSTLVQEDAHMLASLRYIDRNPVKAGLVDTPIDWKYSTYVCYALGKSHEVLEIEMHPVYLALAGDSIRRESLYRDYVNGPDRFSDALSGYIEKVKILGSEEYIKLWK